MSLPVLYNGADASNPLFVPLPAGTRILLGYIGIPLLAGAPDTPKIWTTSQWNQYLDPDSSLYGGPDLRPCPIYVHDYPGDPAADAINAAAAAVELGWAANLGRIIWWDAEMLIDPLYCAQLAAELNALGFRLGKYGSASTVNQNPPVPGGSWIAELAARRPRVLAPDRVGQQYLFGPWDLDVFSQFVYDNCGIGPRFRGAELGPAEIPTSGSPGSEATSGTGSSPAEQPHAEEMRAADPHPWSTRPRPA